MHNLDRTQAETYGETYEYGPAEFGYETNPEYAGEYAGEFAGEAGEYGEIAGEYAGEYGEMPGEYGEYAGEYGEFAGEYGEMPGEYGEMPGEYGEFAGEYGEFGEYSGELEFESPMSEALEMELASELLEVTNEEELDRFLGKIFRGIGRVVRRVVRLPVVRQLGGILKGVARKALPVVGGALGSMVAPGIGTAIGSSLGSLAGRMFELELEGLSAEDQEFEVARRYVRLAASAAQRAALAPPHVPPRIVARRAFNAAARRHAPGLVNVFVPPMARRRRIYRRRGVAPYAVPGVPVAPMPVPVGGAPVPVPGPVPAVGPAVAPVYGGGVPRRRWPRAGRWFRQGRNVVLVGYYG